MARSLTRGERIVALIYENAKLYGVDHMMASHGYCSALVDGLIAVYNKVKGSKMDDRQERIAKVMDQNRDKNGFKGSLAYAEAYVDGQLSIEPVILNYSMTSPFEDEPCSPLPFPFNEDEYTPDEIKKLKERKVDFNEARGIIDTEMQSAINRIKEKKMTREEAIKIGYKYCGGAAIKTIKLLEELDLIKFDEPKSLQQRIDEVALRVLGGQSKICWRDLETALKKAGLKVVEVDSEKVETVNPETSFVQMVGRGTRPDPINKRKYIFFPHPDAGKDNVGVYQDDAIKTMKEYGFSVLDKNGNML